MTAAPPPVNDARRTIVVGAVLLSAGFAAGFAVGRESARQAGAPAQVAIPHDPAHTHDHGDAAPVSGGVMPARTGHTFTGDVSVPPHGADGHRLAGSLLAGVACPCGGCGGEPLLACGCDLAKEIEGLAAHLLERGKPRHEVLAQLSSRYGIVAAGPLRGGDALSGLAETLGATPDVRGPADVPTGARRTASPGRTE